MTKHYGISDETIADMEERPDLPIVGQDGSCAMCNGVMSRHDLGETYGGTTLVSCVDCGTIHRHS